MPDAFDIDDLRATDTDDLAIVHPVTGKPTSWVWTLAGPAHPDTIAQANRSTREMLKTQRMKENAATNRKKWIEPERTPEEVRRENAESFAARVLGWTPARINKEDYPFSKENVVRLLLDPAYGRIYAQLLEYFSSDDSFTNRSATA